MYIILPVRPNVSINSSPSSVCNFVGSLSSTASHSSKNGSPSGSQQDIHQHTPANAKEPLAAKQSALKVHAEPVWSHEPVLAETEPHSTTAAQHSDLGSGSVYGDGDWLPDGTSIGTQHAQHIAATNSRTRTAECREADEIAVVQQQDSDVLVTSETDPQHPTVQASLSSKPVLGDVVADARDVFTESHSLPYVRDPTSQKAAARHLNSCDSTASSQDGSVTSADTDTSRASSHAQRTNLRSKACGSPMHQVAPVKHAEPSVAQGHMQDRAAQMPSRSEAGVVPVHRVGCKQSSPYQSCWPLITD